MTLVPSNMVSRISPSAQWPHLLDANQRISPIQTPTGTGTQAMTADRLYIFPLFLPVAMALTEVGTIVTAGAASSTIRMAILGWDHVNKEVSEVVADLGAGKASEVANQGLVSYTSADASLPLTLETGWYAFAMVSGGTPTFRYLKGTDAMVGSAFDVVTTTLVATNYYYATGTGMVAGGITDPGDYSDLTEVTSASDFTVFNAMVFRGNLNPKVPA